MLLKHFTYIYFVFFFSNLTVSTLFYRCSRVLTQWKSYYFLVYSMVVDIYSLDINGYRDIVYSMVVILKHLKVQISKYDKQAMFSYTILSNRRQQAVKHSDIFFQFYASCLAVPIYTHYQIHFSSLKPTTNNSRSVFSHTHTCRKNDSFSFADGAINYNKRMAPALWPIQNKFSDRLHTFIGVLASDGAQKTPKDSGLCQDSGCETIQNQLAVKFIDLGWPEWEPKRNNKNSPIANKTNSQHNPVRLFLAYIIAILAHVHALFNAGRKNKTSKKLFITRVNSLRTRLWLQQSDIISWLFGRNNTECKMFGQS